jgi:cyclophilin family peptidyl-prolyl cis-trans isomerase
MKSLFISSLFLLILTSCFSKKQQIDSSSESMKQPLAYQKVRIKTIHGDIVFKFYPEDAPATVRRISDLVTSGFYNGLSFHRVVDGFVVQGGDPTGTGSSGSGKKLKAEFNQRKHIKGTVAMARAQDPDSADSQFYISLGDFPHLDGQYTVFGQVIEGIDVASKIKQGDKMIAVVLED